MSGGLLLSTVSGDGRCRLVCCPSAKEDTELDQVASFRKLQRPALRHSVEQWAAAEGSLSLSLHEGPNISPLDVNLASKHTPRVCVFISVSKWLVDSSGNVQDCSEFIYHLLKKNKLIKVLLLAVELN